MILSRSSGIVIVQNPTSVFERSGLKASTVTLSFFVGAGAVLEALLAVRAVKQRPFPRSPSRLRVFSVAGARRHAYGNSYLPARLVERPQCSINRLDFCAYLWIRIS